MKVSADPNYLVLAEKADLIEGFMGPMSIAIWDIFLSFQTGGGIAGNSLEIGVYKGKSATILLRHLQKGEALFLVDFSDFIEEARVNLGAGEDQVVHYIKRKSSQIHAMPEFTANPCSFRWIHIDGEHTGQAVDLDLTIAERLLSDEGIICLDDFFNPAYPQVTGALYDFVQRHSRRLTLFACGFNKAYLARPMFVRNYHHLIKDSFADELKARGQGGFTIWKTSPSDDCNCWGFHDRYQDCDYRGLDSDPTEIY